MLCWRLKMRFSNSLNEFNGPRSKTNGPQTDQETYVQYRSLRTNSACTGAPTPYIRHSYYIGETVGKSA